MSYTMVGSIYIHDTQTIKLQRCDGGYDVLIENADGNSICIYCFGKDVILSANLIDNKEETEKLKEEEVASEPA